MKIALIGASGFVGSAILNELVTRGHIITAIVRNPEKVKKAENVNAVKADVLDSKQVADVVKDHDVVVNSFNPGWDNPNIYKDSLKGEQAIQEGVKIAEVKRLFVIGGAGSLYIAPDKQLVDSPDFPEDWKQGALASRDYYKILQEETELDWTFLSPAIEMHQGTAGNRTGSYRKGLDSPVFDENNRSVISVEDMAIAIADELEDPQHIRERFTVGY